jgi:hypothetical protein
MSIKEAPLNPLQYGSACQVTSNLANGDCNGVSSGGDFDEDDHGVEVTVTYNADCDGDTVMEVIVIDEWR